MKSLIINTMCIITMVSLANRTIGQQTYKLNFNKDKFVVQTLSLEGKEIKVRAFENIVYAANPTDTTYQKLNIYIPDQYFNGQSINGYDAQTAPIFFPNQIGGYMAAKPASLAVGNREFQRPSAILAALSRGYVVVSAGARGRSTQSKEGKFTGKAPAGIVDLKAAIRYLKYNDAAMPGNASKIISNGTSAGGAMSTLLGATGNNRDYEPYLTAIGAAPAKDDVYAVSAYCPITNLDNADMAYEWQFCGTNTYRKWRPGPDNMRESSELSTRQIAESKQLKELFPAYVNGLQLKDKTNNLLTLDKNGDGPFKDLVKMYVGISAQKALEGGTDMTKYPFLTIAGGKVQKIDFEAYVKYMERQKAPPAFDALDLSTPENQEFGTESNDKQHFTDYAMKNSELSASLADKQVVKMMNPMYYIGRTGTSVAQHWRIRHGSKDKDTGLAIPVILSTFLQNNGIDVDFALPWDRPHSGDYDLEELFNWMDKVCKQ